MFTRRDFMGCTLGGLSCLSLKGVVPALFARSADEARAADMNDHVLVVVELAGGNDGLNTVIPFENPLYYKNRPTLGIPAGEAIKLNDQVGLHPRMGPLAELFKEGKVNVVQGVGYPEADRSHFRSMEIWHTASTDTRPPTSGWLGKFLDAGSPAGVDEAAPRGLALTGVLPQAFQAEKTVVPVVAQLDQLVDVEDGAAALGKLRRKLSTAPGGEGEVGFLRRQADLVYRTAERLREAAAKYESEAQYPEGELGPQLRRAAQIIAADMGVRVLFASQGGYDTHANQAGTHGELLEQLAASLAAFQDDLESHTRADRVLVVTFSEFGRRVDENGSQGTDHGAGSFLFLTGSKVKGGLSGEYPSLEKLGDGDLIHTVDFRSVYATVLERWLGCPAEELLGQKFAPLDVL
ncbi:MAG: DUF1501 domain-containing protein [Planctomycetes bacterium]|nr:DUF1501 domain-containing protein [Planctomycetota bacterium]